MTKYILVSGNIWKAQDEGKAFCEELVKGINKKPINILDCMFARPRESWNEKFEEDNIFFSKFINNFRLELADLARFKDQVKNSDIIFLRGGETKILFDLLAKNKDWIKELDGKVLAGTSAGAEVVCKYYLVLKTNRIGEGLDLLPFKVIPHWKSDYYLKNDSLNIDWDKTLNEFKEYKEDLPIYTLAEGEFKVILK